MQKNTSKKQPQRRKLAIKKETVICLTDDLLKNVVGGVEVTASNPFSKCNTQCA